MITLQLSFFLNFVQTTVAARRQDCKNQNFSAKAESLELLANSSCSYHKTDRSRLMVTKYLNVEKTQSAKISKFL